MRRWSLYAIVAQLVVAAAGPVLAVECRIEMVDGMPAGVDAGIVKQLQPKHIKLCVGDDGDGEELCEIWTTKAWKTADNSSEPGDFAPIDYAILPGSLVGVLRVARPCLDFREQELPAGTYTLRYAVQPDLDVHYESHESRDFLLVVPAADDKSPAPIEDAKRLTELSAAVTATTHPSIVPLVKPTDVEREELLRRDEKDAEGWILLLRGADDAGKVIPLELIVIRANEEAAP